MNQNPDEYLTYRQLRDAGCTPAEVDVQAREDELSPMKRMGMLSKLFGLELVEAKRVVVFTNQGITLEEHEASLIEPIKLALEAYEAESEEPTPTITKLELQTPAERKKHD